MKYKLHEVFEFIRNGANIKQGIEGGYPITRIETISDRYINRDKMGYAGIYDLSKYEDYLLKDGDILMSHINSEIHLGKSAIYQKKDPEEKIIHGMNLLCLRPNPKIIFPKYVFYYFNTHFFKMKLNKIIKKSVNQASFSVTDLKKIEIDIPNIDIQIKIANTLDKAQELIDKRNAQIEALDQLTQSVFLEMFGDPLGNPKGWQKITFKDYISKVNKINLKNSKNNIKYIDISSIDNNKNKITSYTEYIGIEAPSRAQQVVQKGDILISTVRPNLKNIAMVMDNYDNLICSTGFCVIRCTEKLNNDFIFHLIKTDSFTKNLVKKTTGANYPAVKNSDIYNESIIYPPKDLQEKFSNITKQIEEKKRFLENSLSYQEKLFNSILQKAFNGELFTEEKASNF